MNDVQRRNLESAREKIREPWQHVRRLGRQIRELKRENAALRAGDVDLAESIWRRSLKVAIDDLKALRGENGELKAERDALQQELQLVWDQDYDAAERLRLKRLDILTEGDE